MLNDKGQIFLPFGAPGSPARVRVQYPALIEQLNSIHSQDGDFSECVSAIRDAGVVDRMTTMSLIEVSNFGSDPLYLELVKSGML